MIRDISQMPLFASIARKCSLPVRGPVSGTTTLLEDCLPLGTTIAQSNEFALRAFVYDYCHVSANANLSRGYLSGLERMLSFYGPRSNLTRACQAVACGSLGIRSNRPLFVDRSVNFYQDLLSSLAKSISDPLSPDKSELRLVAMLLGLYQVYARRNLATLSVIQF